MFAKSRISIVAGAMLALLCQHHVLAADGAAAASIPAIAAGARLAANCAACHGTNGATVAATTGGALPSLAGQPQQTLSASLRAFKAGTRPATIMSQIAKGYTDEQLELLAAYFATQKK